MTEQELAAIEARVAAASAGPWRSRWRELAETQHEDTESIVVTPDFDRPGSHEGNRVVVGLLWHDGHHAAVTEDNAEFIAAARQDVPALLAEVRRLRELGWGNCETCIADVVRCHCRNDE
jgi:hypothetical protein